MISKIKKLVPNFVKVFYHKLRFFLASISSGFAHRDMKIIGVTGSSGKSTTSFMIYHILQKNGFNVGLISTIGAFYNEEMIDIGLHVTTPDAHNLPKLFKFFKDKGAEYIVLESSSHALDQGRLGNIKFDISVFTNITSDHLDWHGSWEKYANAKSKLIDMTKSNGLTVINKDDEKSYRYLVDKLNNRRYKEYSQKDLKEVQLGFDLKYRFDDENFFIPIIGGYNISNALAATLVALELGMNIIDISLALKSFETLEGHMEVIKDKPYSIILDFAHNTDALEKSLIEVRKIAKGKILSLFGSAGLRDRKKRYDMGKTGGEYSDIVIIVPEDPRTESLFEINSKILEGTTDSGLQLIKRFSTREEYLKLRDAYKNSDKGVFVFDYESVDARIDGIELGISLLREGDLLITQGKGHEKSLCFGTTEYPYYEKDAILGILNNISK